MVLLCQILSRNCIFDNPMCHLSDSTCILFFSYISFWVWPVLLFPKWAEITETTFWFTQFLISFLWRRWLYPGNSLVISYLVFISLLTLKSFLENWSNEIVLKRKLLKLKTCTCNKRKSKLKTFWPNKTQHNLIIR